MIWSVLKSFACSRVLVALFAALGFFLLPSVREGFFVPPWGDGPWFLSMWYQWDANWYMSITVDGYGWVAADQSNVAFFPLYPLALRGAGWLLGGHYLVAGLLLSSLFLIGGMLWLYRLVEDDFGEDIARSAVWLLAIFPTSVFFTSLYTESLFLMTSVAAFYYARRERWAMAGAFGFLASLTRVTGLLLIIPLLYEYLSRRSFSIRRVRPACLWLALVPAGLVCYMVYLYFVMGKPLAFAETQTVGWGHEFTPVVGSFTHDIPFLLDQSEVWVIYELAATAMLAAFTVLGFRMLPRSYGLYMLVSLLFPLLGGTTKSMSRYLLVIFPVFVMLSLLSRRKLARRTIVAASVALLCLSTMAFASGRWVA